MLHQLNYVYQQFRQYALLFELDWNDEFVNMLKQAGYLGASEEEIVDRWFQTLCRTIGNEQGIDVTGSGYVQINRRDDGKTEVS